MWENIQDAKFNSPGIPLITVDVFSQTVGRLLKLNENKSPGPDSVCTHTTLSNTRGRGGGGIYSQMHSTGLPKRNCTTQLLETVESWNKIIEMKRYIGLSYSDDAKTFDSGPQKQLLRKMVIY